MYKALQDPDLGPCIKIIPTDFKRVLAQERCRGLILQQLMYTLNLKNLSWPHALQWDYSRGST